MTVQHVKHTNQKKICKYLIPCYINFKMQEIIVDLHFLKEFLELQEDWSHSEERSPSFSIPNTNHLLHPPYTSMTFAGIQHPTPPYSSNNSHILQPTSSNLHRTPHTSLTHHKHHPWPPSTPLTIFTITFSPQQPPQTTLISPISTSIATGNTPDITHPHLIPQ